MKATVVDLRYKMNDILKALDRNESVEILYRGKIKGTIVPDVKRASKSVKDHPLFGILKGEQITVDEELKALRGGRYHDI